MPFTPFHFGPGLLIKSVIPNKFSLISFIFVNVVIDFESLYYILTQQYPYHRFFHTYLGVIVPILISLTCLFLFARFPKNTLFLGELPKEFSKTSILTGVIIGGLSHICLDSIMHDDIRPLDPFSSDNNLHLIVTLNCLHLFCLATGLVGGSIIMVRFIRTKMFNKINS